MKKLVLAIGTEWFSRKGGLSTFNRQLCITFTKLGHKVYCYVPDYSTEEASDAEAHNIELIKSKHVIGEDEMKRLLHRPSLPPDEKVDIIIGHGVITGPAMEHLKTTFYPAAKTIYFVHTSPGEIEFLKPEKGQDMVVQKAEEKENTQKLIARNADLVAAVGPHLFFEIQNVLSETEGDFRLVQFDPGLSRPFEDINFGYQSLVPDALLVGRIEDYTLKGVDIAVKAMHQTNNNWNLLINGYPVKPRLVIRGLSFGSDAQMIQKLDAIRTSNLRVQPKYYNPDMEVITEDIRKAAIVLMPSRAEGFGLIALEAISNGRPVLISEVSGLALLLRKIAPEESKPFIIPAGADDNIDGWARSIKVILQDRKLAAQQTEALARAYSKHVGWEPSVSKLLKILGTKLEAEVEHVVSLNNSASDDAKPILIEPGVLKHSEHLYELRTTQNDFFSGRMALAFAGIRDLRWFTDPKEIINRLKIFLATPLQFGLYPGRDASVGGTKTPIWWFRGGASMPIKNFTAVSDTKCLIDHYECEVEKMAVFRHHCDYREFIYIRTRAEAGAATGEDIQGTIRNQLSFRKYANQEYAIYTGKIISREEYDDGAAIIDGVPTRFIASPSLRVRYLTPYNFIIASQSSVYNSRKADLYFDDVLNDFLDNNNDEKLENHLEYLMELHKIDSFGYYIDAEMPD